MKFNRTRIAMFGAVTSLFPAMLFAQMDSTAMPVSISQNSQPGQPMQPPAPGAMRDSGPNSGDVGEGVKDRMFLRRATESGIADLKFSQLALEKSPSADVKAFAQTIVDDHTKLDGDLGRVADSMGIMVPKEMNKADHSEYDKLQTLSGADFDTEYLTLMVKGHHRAMREFRMEANTVNDDSLRDVVKGGEHVIHQHLVTVNKLAREKGIAMPEHHGTPAAPPPSPPPPSN